MGSYRLARLSGRGGCAAARSRTEEFERLAAARLPPKDRAVLGALLVDWRTMPASKMAGVSRPTVDSWKTKLKTHFVQCHKAWERDFVK